MDTGAIEGAMARVNACKRALGEAEANLREAGASLAGSAGPSPLPVRVGDVVCVTAGTQVGCVFRITHAGTRFPGSLSGNRRTISGGWSDRVRGVHGPTAVVEAGK